MYVSSSSFPRDFWERACLACFSPFALDFGDMYTMCSIQINCTITLLGNALSLGGSVSNGLAISSSSNYSNLALHLNSFISTSNWIDTHQPFCSHCSVLYCHCVHGSNPRQFKQIKVGRWLCQQSAQYHTNETFRRTASRKWGLLPHSGRLMILWRGAYVRSHCSKRMCW
jgi:hypothetical protein